jgi:hypothetical protein
MKAISVQLPDELYGFLKNEAEKESRSITGQVRHLLTTEKSKKDIKDATTKSSH